MTQQFHPKEAVLEMLQHTHQETRSKVFTAVLFATLKNAILGNCAEKIKIKEAAIDTDMENFLLSMLKRMKTNGELTRPWFTPKCMSAFTGTGPAATYQLARDVCLWGGQQG